MEELGFSDLMKSKNAFDNILDFQLTTTTNATANTVNKNIQEYRFSDEKPIYKKGYKTFFKGDKVIFLRNTKGLIQNGTIAVVSDRDELIEAIINAKTNTKKDILENFFRLFDEFSLVKLDGFCSVDADDELMSFPTIDEMALGYCITVYKSQGGTWKDVVFLAGSNGFGMTSNELYYTAFSRASNSLSIACSRIILEKAMNTSVLENLQTYGEY